jgi:hypothetical protein
VALQFYALNHGMALLSAARHPYEKLTPAELSFVNTYHRLAGVAATRAFYYLLEICTREARHNLSLTKSHTSEPVLEKNIQFLTKTFGPAIAAVHAGSGPGESSIMKAFFDQTPDVPIGLYCQSLQHVYYKHKWSSSYGGPAWGNIADCMFRFVSGENTAEMMLDTVWTLEHNTAAIFNKPTKLFGHNSEVLARILDVQRSGQTVEMALHDEAGAAQACPQTQTACFWLTQRFPGEIGGHVDWFKVEALGAINSYAKDKIAQEKAAKLSPAFKAQLAAQKKAAEATKAAEQKAKEAADAAKKAKEFVVMPGLVIAKVQVPRAA